MKIGEVFEVATAGRTWWTCRCPIRDENGERLRDMTMPPPVAECSSCGVKHSKERALSPHESTVMEHRSQKLRRMVGLTL